MFSHWRGDVSVTFVMSQMSGFHMWVNISEKKSWRLPLLDFTNRLLHIYIYVYILLFQFENISRVAFNQVRKFKYFINMIRFKPLFRYLIPPNFPLRFPFSAEHAAVSVRSNIWDFLWGFDFGCTPSSGWASIIGLIKSNSKGWNSCFIAGQVVPTMTLCGRDVTVFIISCPLMYVFHYFLWLISVHSSL